MDLLSKAQKLFFFDERPDISKKAQSTSGRKRAASFRQKYSLGKILGKGTYSTVRKATDLETKEQVAVKCIDEIDLTEKDAKALEREVKILRTLRHENIIGFKDFYYDSSARMFYIVTEYCPGGEMFDAVVAKTYYSEKKVRKIIAKLADALQYLHSKNVTHRDLKPENILLKTHAVKGDFNPSSIKLADFGFAVQQNHPNEGHLKTVCGSPIYVAPEILRYHTRSQAEKKMATGLKSPGYKSKGVDVWSLGVIMYVLLCGYPPFMDSSSKTDTNEKLFEKIKSGKFEFEPKFWKDVSDEAKDLIRKMLVVNPKKRFTIEQVLKHSWLNQTSSQRKLDQGVGLAVNRTKMVQVKGAVGTKWKGLKNAVNKLRFLSISSSVTLPDTS